MEIQEVQSKWSDSIDAREEAETETENLMHRGHGVTPRAWGQVLHCHILRQSSVTDNAHHAMECR